MRLSFVVRCYEILLSANLLRLHLQFISSVLLLTLGTQDIYTPVGQIKKRADDFKNRQHVLVKS